MQRYSYAEINLFSGGSESQLVLLFSFSFSFPSSYSYSCSFFFNEMERKGLELWDEYSFLAQDQEAEQKESLSM